MLTSNNAKIWRGSHKLENVEIIKGYQIEFIHCPIQTLARPFDPVPFHKMTLQRF